MPESNVVANFRNWRGATGGGSNAGKDPGGFMMGGGGGGGSHYDPAFGGKPTVPSLPGSANIAVGANVGLLPQIEALIKGLSASSAGASMDALNLQIPGVRDSIGAARGNIDELLSGQVPQDVISQIAQQAAEIGAGSGMGPMSPFSNANYLRALGLTSLGMKEKGGNALNALMGSVPRVPLYDPSNLFITPGQQQEWGYMADVMRNAPVPAAAAAANLAALDRGITRGQGYTQPASVGGFNLPIRGGSGGSYGSRFGELPLGPTDTGYPVIPAVGGTYATDPLPAGGMPTDAAYSNWRNLASTWGTPTTSYAPMSDADYYDLLSMDPTMYGYGQPIEDPGMAGPIYGSDYDEFYGAY